MQWKTIGWIMIACVLTLGGAFAQDAAPILKHTFEENDGGWKGLGPTAVVSITHDADSVKTGKGALQFAYAVKKGEMNIMLLPTPDGVLARAKTIRFWIKATHNSPITFVLQEKDGGRYNSIFTVPKNKWQLVELSADDFMLDTGKDAPKDPDGKLGMDKVEGVGIADMAQFFAQGDDALMAAFGITAGPRSLYLDDFVVTEEKLAGSSTLKNGEGALDNFARPQICWLATGDVELSKATGKPLEGAGLQVKYHQAAAKVTAFSRSLPKDALTGAARMSFSVASQKPAKLIIQVEEKGGGKYNTMVAVPGNSSLTEPSISFADFKAANDSKDDNNRLDLDQVTQLIILDASGLSDGADADNTLWINNIKVTRSK